MSVMTMTPESLPLPGNRDENWRYAALRGIAKVDWSQPSPVASVDTHAAIQLALPARMTDSLRLVIFAGRLLPELSDVSDPARLETLGIRIHRRASTVRESVAATPIDQRFAAINQRFAPEVLAIEIAARMNAPSLDILCFSTATSHPAIEITLQDSAQAHITERQLSLESGQDELVVTNLRLDIQVGARAQLNYARLLQSSVKTHHLETLNCRLQERAQLQATQVTLGGISTRSTVFIDHGSQSDVVWNATALADAQQVHDSYVRTHHLAQGASTRQLFRGIASERGRIAFNGHMQVSAEATQSDLQQSLKCLLDGGTAEANVRPQLEIYTDAVTASHGATVGKLDRDMMFYLLSRGIDPQTAESLLKWAFISDVIAKLPLPLRREMETALLDRLPGAIAATA